MIWVKQSTAATLIAGPFVDSGDGVTPETALSLTQAETRLSKNGGAFAQKNDAGTASHGEEGNYLVTLDATDTNTLGRLRISIYVSGALPVWLDCMVLPANVWDSLFGADKLQVDVAEWLGTAAATPTVAGVPEVDVTHWLGAGAPANTGDAFARLGAPAGASVSADIAAVPTATENADELLKRDWTSVTGEAARSVLNAMRFLRNKWSVSGTTLTVTKEDDSTSAWTGTVTTDAGADPITGNDPS